MITRVMANCNNGGAPGSRLSWSDKPLYRSPAPFHPCDTLDTGTETLTTRHCRQASTGAAARLGTLPRAVQPGLLAVATDLHRAPAAGAVLGPVVVDVATRVAGADLQAPPRAVVLRPYHRGEHLAEHAAYAGLGRRQPHRAVGLEPCGEPDPRGEPVQAPGFDRRAVMVGQQLLA